MMNKDEALNLLRTHKPVLAQRFGVTSLALFRLLCQGPGHGHQRRGHTGELQRPGYVKDVLRRPVLH